MAVDYEGINRALSEVFRLQESERARRQSAQLAQQDFDLRKRSADRSEAKDQRELSRADGFRAAVRSRFAGAPTPDAQPFQLPAPAAQPAMGPPAPPPFPYHLVRQPKDALSGEAPLSIKMDPDRLQHAAGKERELGMNDLSALAEYADVPGFAQLMALGAAGQAQRNADRVDTREGERLAMTDRHQTATERMTAAHNRAIEANSAAQLGIQRSAADRLAAKDADEQSIYGGVIRPVIKDTATNALKELTDNLVGWAFGTDRASVARSAAAAASGRQESRQTHEVALEGKRQLNRLALADRNLTGALQRMEYGATIEAKERARQEVVGLVRAYASNGQIDPETAAAALGVSTQTIGGGWLSSGATVPVAPPATVPPPPGVALQSPPSPSPSAPPPFVAKSGLTSEQRRARIAQLKGAR